MHPSAILAYHPKCGFNCKSLLSSQDAEHFMSHFDNGGKVVEIHIWFHVCQYFANLFSILKNIPSLPECSTCALIMCAVKTKLSKAVDCFVSDCISIITYIVTRIACSSGWKDYVYSHIYTTSLAFTSSCLSYQFRP